MTGIVKALILVLSSFVVLSLQSFRFLNIFGIQPNLLLIFLLVVAYFVKDNKEDFLSWVFACLLIALGAFLFVKFYLTEVIVLMVLAGGFLLWRRFLTGTIEFDLSALIFVNSIVFYAILAVWGAGPFLIKITLIEAGLNTLIGFAVSRFFKKRNYYDR